jgi:hypothetical protein
VVFACAFGAGARGAEGGGSPRAVEALRQYLSADPAARADWEKQTFLDAPLTKADAAAAHKLLWEDHVRTIRATRAAEMKSRTITEGNLKMPFAYTIFGDKPAGGRSLFISMHGGGNAPPALNDQQWENQKRLYRPAEGVYLAPRAPTNTWNLWHEAHIDRMFDRLIEDLIVFEDVNPDRVYIMGYSAGGDGVYQLAPRMADRWAAASMMAGHPNDAQPLGLRNLPFTIHVGALDGGFNRNMVAAEWGQKLDELAKSDPGGYVHLVKLHSNKGHWMDREDAEAVPWMAKFTRNPIPAKVAWKQSTVTHPRFYWLAVAKGDEKAGAEIVAQYKGQEITIEKSDVPAVKLRVDDRMMDLDKPITVRWGDKKVFERKAPRTIRVMAQTLNERGDPHGIFEAEIDVKR